MTRAKPEYIDRQQGVVAPLVALSLLAIIGMAGLALDMGHAYINKTRLQNALDAAALSAAKTLLDGGGTAAAQTKGLTTFNQQVTNWNGEAGMTVPAPTFQFSATMNPFTPGANNATARFVRARIDALNIPMTLTRVLPAVGNSKTIGASAVAGPSGSLGDGKLCEIAPMVMCTDNANAGDTDCSDGACFGYTIGTNTEIALKTGSGNGSGNGNGNNAFAVGPGNFQLIQLDCGPGAACVRENMAGSFTGCATKGGTVTTKPGNTVGPVAQGFNTRFGDYTGGTSSADYPPDTVTYSNPANTNQPNQFWYSDYQSRQNAGTFDNQPKPNGIGVPGRRIMPVPIVNCTGSVNGQGTLNVLGFACFFMTRPAEQGGNQRIFGQLIRNCAAEGQVPTTPTNVGGGSLIYKIVLYDDTGSNDS